MWLHISKKKNFVLMTHIPFGMYFQTHHKVNTSFDQIRQRNVCNVYEMHIALAKGHYPLIRPSFRTHTHRWNFLYSLQLAKRIKVPVQPGSTSTSWKSFLSWGIHRRHGSGSILALKWSRMLRMVVCRYQGTFNSHRITKNYELNIILCVT